MKNIELRLLGVLLAFCQLQAENGIIVTANRYEQTSDKVASSFTVLDHKDFTKLGVQNVVEALRNVPALSVVQSGSFGGNVAVFIRGANSEHSLILLDGIELNNPASNARFYNLSNLTLENIERIEVVRGPQSSVYGSDAIGGVINIISKTGNGKAKSTFRTSAGSYDTLQNNFGVSGSQDNLDYSLAGGYLTSHSISAASTKDQNFEADPYQNLNASTNLGYKLSEESKLKLITKNIKSDAQIDNFAGVGGDDLDRKLNNEEGYYRSEYQSYFFDKRLNTHFGAALSDHKLEDNSDPIGTEIEFLRSNYDGRLVKFDSVNNLLISEQVSLNFGIETEKETASTKYLSRTPTFGTFEDNLSEQEARTNGYFTDLALDISDKFFINLGNRVDDHSLFNSQYTYKISPKYLITEQTAVKANYGTGYKAPSLYQLYSTYGTKDLNPEESTGWDLGLEQEFNSASKVGLSYFRNDIDHMINFDPQTFKFANINSAKTSGIELYTSLSLDELTSLDLNYSYLNSEDGDTGEQLLRRASNKLITSLNRRFGEKTNISVSLPWIGNRYDQDYSGLTAQRVKLGSYTLLNLNANYKISEKLALFTSLENIFDKEYQEVLGYGTRGFGVYSGFNLNF